jgi:cytochrome c oxidase subunit 3
MSDTSSYSDLGRSDEPHTAAHPRGDASKIGMWLFLFTEIILFGTLFIAYAVYLHMHTYEFHLGSARLDKLVGATNTVILLTSSLTLALSIAALRRARKAMCLILLAATVVLALTFLTIKGFEWRDKFHHRIYPNSPIYAEWPKGEVAFFGLYYLMTGLHALHVIAGILVMSIAAGLVWKNKIRTDRLAFLENTGLYWHLVDMIWIYLFPLFYLLK